MPQPRYDAIGGITQILAKKIQCKTSDIHVANVLTLSTYDGSGQTAHPSVVYIPDGLGIEKWKYWMAITPYPRADQSKENPSILTSNDGITWVCPSDATNPIVPAPTNINDHNSDTELIFYNNELWLYYRETKNSLCPVEQRIFLTKSSDGIEWSSPIAVVLTTGLIDGLLSPSVVINGTTFYMWLVDGYGNLVRKSSSDGITWSQSTTCVTIGMPPSRNHWHLKIILVRDRYEAIFCTATSTGGVNSKLQFGYSYNGVNWVTFQPFLNPAFEFETDMQYRATFLSTDINGINNVYDIWYTGISNNVWKTAYTQAVLIDNNLVLQEL